VDLNQLLTRLNQLGITLLDDDDPVAQRATLQSQRQYRASLYLPQLNHAANFLTQTLALAPAPGNAGGLGAGYAFVQQAVQAAGLLDGLAWQLDRWCCFAVEVAIRQQAPPVTTIADYQNFFVNTILNHADATWLINVGNFFAQYPITLHALQQITTNFENNIREACRRILNDRAAIANLFSDEFPSLILDRLVRIKSTGSDFHKGGRQVLILTFDTNWTTAFVIPRTGQLKVVYKPADLEIDYLLAGIAAAAQRAAPAGNFQQRSLAEIFNAQVDQNPVAGLEKLPVYRILPCNPTSGAGLLPGGNVPVRNAYGYMEYLAYGETPPFFSFMDHGDSDYIIYDPADAPKVVPKFYRQLGQWLAISCTFSLTDLHFENVRVTTYMPHLIDLENSLLQQIQNPGVTSLFGVIGGITGESVLGPGLLNVVYEVILNAAPAQPVDFDPHLLMTEVQNRLYVTDPGKRIVDVNAYYLLRGLRNGINLLGIASAANAFAAWIGRVNNVLVRALPFATGDWEEVRDIIYHANTGVAGQTLAAATAAELLYRITLSFNNYAPPDEPDFAVMDWAQTSADLQNFDIPAYYHRVGSLDLLDSDGFVVAVPQQIIVTNPAGAPPTIQVNTNAPATFWVATPFTANVVNAQVNPLAVPGNRDPRFTALRTGVLGQMGLAAAPNAPGNLIP
jgi:hypothetical protein